MGHTRSGTPPVYRQPSANTRRDGRKTPPLQPAGLRALSDLGLSRTNIAGYLGISVTELEDIKAGLDLR